MSETKCIHIKENIEKTSQAGSQPNEVISNKTLRTRCNENGKHSLHLCGFQVLKGKRVDSCGRGHGSRGGGAAMLGINKTTTFDVPKVRQEI